MPRLASTRLTTARQREREALAHVASLKHDTATAAASAPLDEVARRAAGLRDAEAVHTHLAKARADAETALAATRAKLRAEETPFYLTRHIEIRARRAALAAEVDAILETARAKLYAIDSLQPEFAALAAEADASPAAEPGKPLFGNMNAFSSSGAHVTAMAAPTRAAVLEIVVKNHQNNHTGPSVAWLLGCDAGIPGKKEPTL